MEQAVELFQKAKRWQVAPSMGTETHSRLNEYVARTATSTDNGATVGNVPNAVQVDSPSSDTVLTRSEVTNATEDVDHNAGTRRGNPARLPIIEVASDSLLTEMFFSADGELFATGSGNQVLVYYTASGEKVRELRTVGSALTDVCLHSAKAMAITLSSTALGSGIQVHSLTEDTDPLFIELDDPVARQIAIDPSGSIVTCAGLPVANGWNLWQWNLPSGELLEQTTIRLSGPSLIGLVSPVGSPAAVVDLDLQGVGTTLRIHQIDGRSVLREITRSRRQIGFTLSATVESAAFSADGELFAYGASGRNLGDGERGYLVVHDLNSRTKKQIEIPDGWQPYGDPLTTSLSMSEDQTLVAVILESSDKKHYQATVYRVDSGEQVHAVPIPTNEDDESRLFLLSGQHILYFDRGILHAASIQDGAPVGQFEVDDVIRMVASIDGRFISMNTGNNSCRVVRIK